MTDQDDESVKDPEKSKLESTHNDSPNKTTDQSVIELDEADSSMVSDTNFSDVCNVEEFDKNRERPAEKILDQLNETGNPAELSLDDPDLERLLDDIYSGHIAKPHW